MNGRRPPPSSPALLGARELKTETRLCLPAAPRQGDGTDVPWPVRLRPVGPAAPACGSLPCAPRGSGGRSPAWELGVAPELFASLTTRGKAGTEGVPEELGGCFLLLAA